MEYQKVAEGPDRCILAVERHCSVCFAPIRDTADAARSQEGHHYCARCAERMFTAATRDGFRAARRVSAMKPTA
jgi:hypothetical protein